jgi:hypothetical protein
MDVIEYIQKHVVSIIKPSPINGVGFFAIRDINEGEHIFTPWGGESGIYSITQEELFTLPQELQTNIYGIFDNKLFFTNKDGIQQHIEKEYGKLFFPLERGYHWQYIWPKMFMNSGLTNANTICVDSNNSISIKKIKKGEELLAGYGVTHKFKPKNFI